MNYEKRIGEENYHLSYLTSSMSTIYVLDAFNVTRQNCEFSQNYYRYFFHPTAELKDANPMTHSKLRVSHNFCSGIDE